MKLSRYTLKNISSENVIVPDQEIFELPEKVIVLPVWLVTGNLFTSKPLALNTSSAPVKFGVPDNSLSIIEEVAM